MKNRIGMTLQLVIVIAFLICSGEEGARASEFDPFGSGAAEALNISQLVSSDGPVIPQVQFKDNDISMVFQIISDSTGWSIFPTSQVSKAKISLWAKDITARELLDKVVALSGFIYHRDKDIIAVMTYDEYMQHYGLERKLIPLKYADAASISGVIKPFLTSLGKVVVHDETNSIILYESEANLNLLAGIIEKLDSPSENNIVEVICLKYADSESLAATLQAVFTDRKKGQVNKGLAAGEKQGGSGDKIAAATQQVEIFSVKESNQLIAAGTEQNLLRVKELVALIDVYGDNIELNVIDLQYADAEALAETLNEIFVSKDSDKTKKKIIPAEIHQEKGEGGLNFMPQTEMGVYSVARTNQLIIKAFKNDIQKLKILVDKLDSYIEPVTKNYHFTYIDASEVYNGLEKILDVSGRSGANSGNRNRAGSEDVNRGGLTLVEKTNSILLTGPPSVHRIMDSIVNNIDKPSTYEGGMIRVYKLENADVEEAAKTIRDLIENQKEQKGKTPDIEFSKETGETQTPGAPEFAETKEYVPQIEARVSLNKSTNSIVVQATAIQHSQLEKLIKELDKRRQQVLITAMIVEVITTDDLSFGVELSHAAKNAGAFSAFGLSTNLDPTTGERNITVSPGGTAAVLRPDKLQTIIQALKSNGNARITSSPNILVNDNAVGFINSIAEEPTTQTSQGQTTTTTSFAGFVEAGTQFAITPHISEKGYLRVEYKITLNSFGTKPTDPSIPPPRNTSSIQSEATVPDGYTIIVGGLQAKDESVNVDKVPILGDIPILGLLFKNTVIQKQYKTTYLFITPTIMESADFLDLKDASRKAIDEIKIEP